MKFLTIGLTVFVLVAIAAWSFIKAYKKPSCCCTDEEKKAYGCCGTANKR